MNYILRCFSSGVKRLFCAFLKKTGVFFRKAFAPIDEKIRLIFGNIAEKVQKMGFYSKIHLKKTGEMEYNKKVQSIVGGEHTGVVKAQIRKKE